LAEHGIRQGTARGFNNLRRQYAGSVGMFTQAAEVSAAERLDHSNRLAQDSSLELGFEPRET